MMPTGLAVARDPYEHQTRCNQRVVAKLDEEGRDPLALVIMPPGAGKTWTMGFYLAEQMPVTVFPKVLVLQSARKILKQNRATLSQATIAIGAKTSVVMARSNDWSGDIVFGSVASVTRPGRLAEMPMLTHIIVDEAHHAGSASYKRIIRAARRANPWLKVLLFTATPNRADGEPIATPDDIAFQMTYAELIDLGILVPVRTLTIDLGLRKDFERIGTRAAANDDHHDDDTLGALLNKKIHHQSVVDHWIEQGGGERNGTVGFCPNVAHAAALAACFRENGINAAHVDGTMSERQVETILDEYEAGRHKVLLSCAMLIEGWDSPRTDCIVNLRMMVAELTFLQAVGRGMRAHPGKTDCLLLDFSGAAQRHGSIETRVLVEREARVRAHTEAHPANDNDGFAIETKAPEVIREFAMREIDIMRQSKPRFVEVPGEQPAMVAMARDGFAYVVCLEGMWHCATRIGTQDVLVSSCATGNEAMAMADRFLLSLGTSRRNFEQQPPTYSQERELRRYLIDDPDARRSRYDAECFIAMAHARPILRRAMGQRGYLAKAA
jgi:superfamily II DNA or RNA helicase